MHLPEPIAFGKKVGPIPWNLSPQGRTVKREDLCPAPRRSRGTEILSLQDIGEFFRFRRNFEPIVGRRRISVRNETIRSPNEHEGRRKSGRFARGKPYETILLACRSGPCSRAGGYGRRGLGGRGSDRSSRIERSCDRPLLAELGGQREPTRQVWQNFPFFGRLPRSRRRGEDSPCPWGQTNEQRSVAKGAVRVAFRAALLEWPLLSDLFSPLKSSLDSQTFDWSQDLSLSNWDSKDVVAILT